MPKTRLQKEEQINELAAVLKASKGIAFANPGAITVADTTTLRRKCQEEHVRLIVAKKTLLTIALREAGIDLNAKTTLEGTVGVALSADEVAPAKVLNEFSKGREGFSLLGGVLENKFIDRKAVVSLASLPSKQEMLGKLVGTLQAPISSFVRVLAGPQTGFVRALSAISQK